MLSALRALDLSIVMYEGHKIDGDFGGLDFGRFGIEDELCENAYEQDISEIGKNK